MTETDAASYKNTSTRVEFLGDSTFPFDSPEVGLDICIGPHQSSLLGKKPKSQIPTSNAKRVSIGCGCVPSSKEASRASFRGLLEDCKTRRNGEAAGYILWVNPTRLPEKCLACIVASWVSETTPEDGISLAIICPELIQFSHRGNWKTWRSSPEGALRLECTEIALPIWYPSLEIEPDVLKELLEQIRPFDVFPLVEFPKDNSPTSDELIWRHKDMMESFQIRTDSTIYVNPQSPQMAYQTVLRSLQALPRAGSESRTALVTPRGGPCCYLAIFLAAIISEAVFLTPPEGIPFSVESQPADYAILRKVR